MSTDRDAYADAGVDIEAGNRFVQSIGSLVARTQRPGFDGKIGGFGGLFDLQACGFKDPLLVAATDGVGTKLLLGIEADRLEGLGQDLVAMCVNDLVVQGAAPLFFLDYLATSKLEPAKMARLVDGISAACAQSGCALIGGETAEMPGLYGHGHFDLAGFAVGAVERQAVLPKPTIAAGDLVVGLRSSGLHSNGFSLVRKILTDRGLDLRDRSPVDRTRSVADEVLEPTRLYVQTALALSARDIVKGFAHITGGGLLENLPRVLPEGLMARLSLDPLPPFQAWLADAGGIGEAALYRTFNAGIGMVVICAPSDEQQVIELATAHGEQAMVIGVIEHSSGGERCLIGSS